MSMSPDISFFLGNVSEWVKGEKKRAWYKVSFLSMCGDSLHQARDSPMQSKLLLILHNRTLHVQKHSQGCHFMLNPTTSQNITHLKSTHAQTLYTRLPLSPSTHSEKSCLGMRLVNVVLSQWVETWASLASFLLFKQVLVPCSVSVPKCILIRWYNHQDTPSTPLP